MKNKIKSLIENMNDNELLNIKKMWLKRKKYEKFLLRPDDAHMHIFSILDNNIRKEILKFIGKQTKTFEDIKKYFNFNIYELKFHLGFLEYALFIKKVNIGWRITSRGNVLLQKIEK